MFNRKKSVKPLLLAGIAAAAYYAYTRMSEEQKKNIADTIRTQGKDLLGRFWKGGSAGVQETVMNA